MRLDIHQSIAALSNYKSTDRVTFEQHLQGHRHNVGPVIDTIERVADNAEYTNNGLLITLTKDPFKRGEENLWTRLTHVRYTAFISGPVWACQVYLHALEGRHGHRR
jgi:hypothetical protein